MTTSEGRPEPRTEAGKRLLDTEYPELVREEFAGYDGEWSMARDARLAERDSLATDIRAIEDEAGAPQETPGLSTREVAEAVLREVRAFVAAEPAREGAGLHFAISQARVLTVIDSMLDDLARAALSGSPQEPFDCDEILAYGAEPPEYPGLTLVPVDLIERLRERARERGKVVARTRPRMPLGGHDLSGETPPGPLDLDRLRLAMDRAAREQNPPGATAIAREYERLTPASPAPARPFAVTDPSDDAPDGTVMTFERVRGTWEPRPSSSEPPGLDANLTRGEDG